MERAKSKRRNINSNKVELLVPAGGMEQFLAAVENGADAIYVGGQLFNARAGAQNFNDDELVLALDYAHKRGVKVYVTMNTLLSDDELETALRYASFLHDSGVDAIIVQDLGLGELVRRALPDLELHMSTQATITDVESAKVVHELGYRRIVVARELALPEIATICRAGSDGASILRSKCSCTAPSAYATPASVSTADIMAAGVAIGEAALSPAASLIRAMARTAGGSQRRATR